MSDLPSLSCAHHSERRGQPHTPSPEETPDIWGKGHMLDEIL